MFCSEDSGDDSMSRMARKLQRLTRLRRALSPDWLRFLVLMVTDPGLDYLDYYVKNKSKFNPTDPRPHYAIGAIRWLTNVLSAGKISTVVEWGSGNSTAWFLRFGCEVWAIEHDKRWYETIKYFAITRNVPNLNVIYADRKELYVRPTSVPFARADLIVIDGIYRIDCALFLAALKAEGRMKPGCIVLFDDAQRQEYEEGIRELRTVASDWDVFAGPVWVDLDHLTLLFKL